MPAQTRTPDVATFGDIALVENASDAVIVRDQSDRVVFWNRGAEALYGWSRREVLGLGIHDLLRTRFPTDRSDALSALRRDGEWDGHVQQHARDGAELIVWTRWTAVVGSGGEIVSVLEVSRDITAEQRSLASLRARLAELEGASAAQGRSSLDHGSGS